MKQRLIWSTVMVGAVAAVTLGQEDCQSSDADGDGWTTQDGDCDDRDGEIHPGADELCDQVDNDCDGSVDEDAIDAATYYTDLDADGFGDPASASTACAAPDGYISDGNDCDDSNAAVNPDAQEILGNGIDDDCDGHDRQRDLNDDGYADLIVSNYYNGSSYSVNSTIFWGGSKGIISTNKTDLATIGALRSCVADYDGDGYQDIFFTNHYNGSSYSLSSYLYRGTSSGYSSSSRQDLATIGAYDCDFKDLEGDGDLDLVIANYYNGTTRAVNSYVFWNVGGYYTSQLTQLPTSGAAGVVAEDLNNDGYLELIFANYYGSTYTQDSYIYWGASSGYSSSNISYLPTIGALRRPIIYDINHDGNKDILMTNYYDGTNYNVNSYIYWGPTYTTTNRTSLPTSGARDAKIRDVDHDGYEDIIFANYYDGDDSVNSYVYYGSASGYSTTDRISLSTNRAFSVDVDDLDHDGFDDIALAIYYDGDYATSSVVFYGSLGGYSSSAKSNYTTNGARDALIRDLDGDYFSDLIFSGYRTDESYSTNGYVYWNSSRGVDNSTRSSVTVEGATSATVADITGDAYPELLISAYYDGSSYDTASVMVEGGDPFRGNDGRVLLPTSGSQWHGIADLNQDGYQDIVISNYLSGTDYTIDSYIYWGGEDGFIDDNRTALPTNGALRGGIFDLDLDGDLDVVFGGYYNGSSYSTDTYVYWNEGGVFATSARVNIPATGVVGVAASDLDGNGYMDLVLTGYRDASTYNVGVYLFWGDASGYSTSHYQLLTAYGAYNPVVIEDVNNDTYLDLVISCYYDGDDSVNSYVYWGSTSGYSDGNRTALGGYRTPNIAVADLNLDGWKDIVMATYYDGNYATSSYIYWGSTSGFSSSNRASLTTNGAWDVSLADFDSDGRLDIAFTSYRDDTDYSTNSNVFWNSASGFSSSNVTNLSTYGSYWVTAGDLDLNGHTDLIFSNYYDGTNYNRDSYIYWNSTRGISNSNRTSFAGNGQFSLNVIGG